MGQDEIGKVSSVSYFLVNRVFRLIVLYNEQSKNPNIFNSILYKIEKVSHCYIWEDGFSKCLALVLEKCLKPVACDPLLSVACPPVMTSSIKNII